jgi:hypothetical protein
MVWVLISKSPFHELRLRVERIAGAPVPDARRGESPLLV